MFKRAVQTSPQLLPFEKLPKVGFADLHIELKFAVRETDSQAKYACRIMVAYVAAVKGISAGDVRPSQILTREVASAVIQYRKADRNLPYYARKLCKILGQPDLIPDLRRKYSQLHLELVNWLVSTDLSTNHRTNHYRWSCMTFLDWLTNYELTGHKPFTVPVAYIQRRHLLKYRNHLLTSVMRGNKTYESARGVLASTIRWVKWLIDNGRIAQFDVSKITIKHGVNRTRRMATHTQLSKFMSAVSGHEISNDYKLYFLLLLATGARPVEIEMLTLKDIDSARQSIFLNSKNGPGRWIPLPIHVWTALESKLKQSEGYCSKEADYILTGQSGKQLNCHTIQGLFKMLKSVTSVDIDGLMAFRHRFATDCYENGVPVAVFQYLMGHRTLHEMKRYQHSNIEIQKHEINHAFNDDSWVRDINDW